MPKRKRAGALDSARRNADVSRKSVKANDLPWKVLAHSKELVGEDEGGMLMLEEVEGVDVTFEESSDGRVVRFYMNSATSPLTDLPDAESAAEAVLKNVDSSSEGDETETASEWGGFATEAIADGETSSEPKLSLDSKSSWDALGIHGRLQELLLEQSLSEPTPIQRETIPLINSGRDVVGVAQTGSGKTLAYALPIVSHLFTSSSAPQQKKICALILAPTRELALQVRTHIQQVVAGRSHSDDGSDSEAVDPIRVAALVGGMSLQKQTRLLERGQDILIATPGRLWDILSSNDVLVQQIKKIRFLVLDEADRMIENGHYDELENILKLTNRMFQVEAADPEFDGMQDVPVTSTNDDMQTLVFSATMSKDLQQNLKRRRSSKVAKARKNNPAPTSTFDELLLRFDFRDETPEFVDLTPQGGVATALQESKIECMSSDKDLYLYYFLLRYPGRTLVFVSSISSIRRIVPLFNLLRLPIYPLHSQMEQRQRLKNLDRFKSNSRAILLATDVAARGLDIQGVDHVVHYHVPASADSYVHRSGRTARASKSGLSLALCAPEERKVMEGILRQLHKDDSDVAEMEVEHDLLGKLKVRIQLARRLDTQAHSAKKRKHEQNWVETAAAAMDIVVDSELEMDEAEPAASRTRVRNSKQSQLTAELDRLLRAPLIVRGVSARYLTSGSRGGGLAEDLVQGVAHETILGARRLDAGAAVINRKRKSKLMGQHYNAKRGPRRMQ